MSKSNTIVNTPLRRSARLLHLHKAPPPEPQDPNTLNSIFTVSRRRSARFDSTLKTQTLEIKVSKEHYRPSGGSREPPRLNDGFVSSQTLRRSPRFCNQPVVEQLVRKTGNEKAKRKSSEAKVNKSKRKIEAGVKLCEEIEVPRISIVLGLKAFRAAGIEMKKREVGKENHLINDKRKRKHGEEGTKSSKIRIEGWTKEQEVALQRAYFATKPTPHFWKKVSKLVPGKSIQECFDKVHSDHLTPAQPRPQSRANKLNSSPIEHFSLSASKLLNPVQPKIKRSSCNKKKSHLTQKTVRHLLQKNCHIDKDYKADLFSVFEPNINTSIQVCQQNGFLSTPKHLQKNQEFLQKYLERSSGSGKKPLSRFSSSCGTALISPPVLKQVKNIALHEKYIDQLHSREAKRKAASVRADQTITGKENKREIYGNEVDVVKAAKIALITDAKNAINQFQHLQADSTRTSSDFDCDGVSCDDDEGKP
ncbi:uncharacterized protein LOC123198566 isoform X2 [Mangifera indica]|uniref:uncharacterized protein LOC123198566 isoform X2 n=1 Tax=Mangifera indica TaxID=29780 RepID=UPI001CFA88E8|nr:uncharacterized protein LOC123198566 isoform X2 [Mangifera indica]